jgi:2-keto-3-deoxy-L-rhamnonate aldolase RhmA
VLEAGPDGIIFPLVNTAEDARRCVEVCKYPPVGIRGYGPRRAQLYGHISDADFYKMANDSVMLIMQCERKESVDNLEEILAVPGVDGIIVGLNDLSASVDKFGQIDDPEVVDMVDQIMTKCKKAGKPFGVSLGYHFELAKFWIDNGASFVSMGFPQDYYFMVGKDAVARIRKMEDEHTNTK